MGMTKRVRNFRLRHLIETMLNVPKERFNMNSWASNPSGVQCEENLSCGAAGCALGWEASTPYARRAGLKLRAIGSGITAEPIYKGFINFDAGSAFFGITGDEADYLFDPSEYPSYINEIRPEDVIVRVAEIYRKHNQPA